MVLGLGQHLLVKVTLEVVQLLLDVGKQVAAVVGIKRRLESIDICRKRCDESIDRGGVENVAVPDACGLLVVSGGNRFLAMKQSMSGFGHGEEIRL